MSASIDERVVELRFDNSKFGSGVKDSLSLLDRLKNALHLKGATDGLDNVQKAASHFSLSGMADNLANVSSKFSLLGAVGFTVVQSLTRSAISVGKKMGSALIDPIVEGGKTRALNIEQAKFQFKGLGMDVDKSMKSALDAVTGTSYGLDEAAKTASQFGAGGIKAGKDMTGALRGVAGIAAMTGSSFSDIGQIFTTVAGQGKLTTEQMNQFATRGINAWVPLAKSMHVSTAQLHKMVTDGKVDFKTFAGAMDDAFGAHAKEANQTFTGALANMKAALSRIGADFESAKFDALKNIFNALTPVIDSVHEAMQPLIDAFAQLMKVKSDNIVKFLKSLKFDSLKMSLEWITVAVQNVGKLIASVLKPLKGAFTEIFPPTAGSKIVQITQAIAAFTAKLQIGGSTADKLKRTFAGVFAIFGIGWEVVKQVAKTLAGLFGVVSHGGGSFLNVTANIGDFLVKVHDAVKNGTALSKFFKGLGKVLALPIKALQLITKFISGLFDGFNNADTSGIDRFSDRMSGLKRLGAAVKNAFAEVGKSFQKLGQWLSPVGKVIGNFFKNLPQLIADALGNGNYSTILDTLNTGLFAALILMLKKFFKNGLMAHVDVGSGLIDKIKGSFGQLTSTLKTMQMQLKASILMKIAAAIALLTLSVVALSLIDSDKLTKAMGALAVAFSELLGAMIIMEKISKSGSMAKMPLLAASLVLLALAIDVLVLAVAALATMDWEELAKGLGGVVVLIGALVVASGPLSKNSKGMITAGAGMALMAGAILLLATAVKKLGNLDLATMAKGLGGVAALLVSLALFSKFSKANKGGVLSGAGILLLALGISVLEKAVEKFAKMSWGDMGKGLAGVAGGLLAIGLALKLVPAKSVISAAAIFLVATSLSTIGDAIKKMGSMEWSTIGKGIAGLAGALILIAAALMLLPPSTLLSAAAIFVVAASLGMIADALGEMGGMTWEEIAKGLITLAGSLTIIAAAMYVMTGALPGAAATLIVAVALRALAPVLQMFANMSWEGLIKGLVGLAGVFVILGVAGIALAPVTPILLLLSAAILGMGAGMLMAATATLVMIVAIKQIIPVFTAIGSAIAGAVKWAVGLIPGLWSIIKSTFTTIVNFLKTMGPKVGSLAKTIVMAIWNAITKLAPKIASAALSMVTGIFNAVKKTAPKVISAAASMMTSFLGKITGFIGRVLSAGKQIASNVLAGVRSKLSQMRTAATTAMSNFVNGIRSKISSALSAAKSAANSVVNGIKSTLRAAVSTVSGIAKSIGNAIVSGIKSALTGGMGGLISKAKSLVSAPLNAAKSLLHIGGPSKLWRDEIGVSMPMGAAAGMDKKAYLVEDAAEEMGNNAIESMRKSLKGLSSIILDDAVRTPVITPMLDLTSVKKDASTIDNIFQSSMASVRTGRNIADNIIAQNHTTNRQGITSDTLDLAAQQRANSIKHPVIFNQYNNSPKALSSAEIYRQTKNQISTMKGALNK